MVHGFLVLKSVVTRCGGGLVAQDGGGVDAGGAESVVKALYALMLGGLRQRMKVYGA